ncbi:MAG: cyclic nucleotide-binding domain-containing protein [Lachnospiraceae bacterium]|nr:cyclic nucleotide-binding domain-containing protein [Lachnospiraceae bacterium]
MADNGKIIKFPRDCMILREGEKSTDMYKIIKGHAELYTGYGTENEVLLGLIGAPACFGEFGLLLHQPSIYTVVAFDNVYALRISEGEIGDFVQENHRNIIDIMKNMANMMLVMQRQIDILAKEIKKGSTGDVDVIRQAKRNLRSYAVYGSGFPPGGPYNKINVMNYKV